jgi:rRNA 2'-O-methyltransferase fibrillarin
MKGGNGAEKGKGKGKGGGKGKGKGKGGGKGKGKGKGKGAASTAPVVENFWNYAGIYKAVGLKSDSIMTKNMVPGVSVYGEKRITAEIDEVKVEYRVWNPFRSKLGAFLLAKPATFAIAPGSHVLYLGAASGTTVSHVSDIVGDEGMVYAVEFSHRPGRDLTNLASSRRNIVPIVDDARKPQNYRFLVGMVDCIFSDVAQPDQSRIVGLNAEMFLKKGGWFCISLKASCVDSTVAPEIVYAAEKDALTKLQLKAKEGTTLEPYHKNHLVYAGIYRPDKKDKSEKSS